MGRRKKGQPVDGWLIIDKPEGVTSSQAVGKARWAFDAQKAGHAGTLDPLATGVLAIAFGEATKTAPYVTDALKAYRFTVKWGEARDTDDTEGAVIARSDIRPAQEAVEAALPEFTGEIQQVPPKYSAIKVEGERAYDIMREGDDVELPSRPIWVESLTLIEAPDPDSAVFEMVCGKGGYVRAIARDLGLKLGCYGHITQLRRIWSGPFDAENGVSFADLDALKGDPEACQARLLPVALGLDGVPMVPVNDLAAAKLRSGQPVPVPGGAYGETVWAEHGGQPVAIGVVKGGKLHPSRVINPPQPWGDAG